MTMDDFMFWWHVVFVVPCIAAAVWELRDTDKEAVVVGLYVFSAAVGGPPLLLLGVYLAVPLGLLYLLGKVVKKRD